MAATEKLIATVPSREYSQPGLAAGQRWTVSFNASCWVRCRDAADSLVRFVLRVRDDSGKEREVLVDRGTCAREGTLLLAARIDVPVSGRIEEITAWLVAQPAASLSVDELFVQRTGAAAASKPLISSR